MSDDSLHISFIQNHVPALESGEYKIAVTQTVTANSQTQGTYTAEQSFYVSGKRYSLEAGEVNSMYPPLGSAGQYDSVLPHIALNTSSLPWQRTTGYTGNLNGGNKAQWLALLLFDESENIGAAQQVTLGDLVTNSTTFFPPRIAEPGETDSDPVNVIDIPLTLFNQVCPSVMDLQWLAHVRQVSVANKSTSNDAAANDTYAIVFCNRLPQTDRVSTMHLVSLENYNSYLPLLTQDISGYNLPSANIPVGISTMRLVSLYSWSFRCAPHAQSFGGLLMNADMNPATLQMPFVASGDPSITSQQAQANQKVEDAFGMGYTAVNHQLRNGGRTVSWYRGPLLPLGTPYFMVPPYTNADQLMRYDPQIGMLDATYAASWQLGKLLALQDNAYAQTLVRWKAKQTDAIAQGLEEAIIDEQFEIPGIENQEANMKKQSRISFSIKNVAAPAAVKINQGDNPPA